jgi:Flp pilus assembly protein TadG
MRARRIRDTWKNEKGQSLVEFALVVPMLLLLVIGIAELGRAWMTKNIMTGAAREAVRILAVPDPPGGPTAARNRAIAVLASGGITTPPATIGVTDNTAFLAVRVTIDYPFPVVIAGFIPGLSGVTFPLSSETTMRREY